MTAAAKFAGKLRDIGIIFGAQGDTGLALFAILKECGDLTAADAARNGGVIVGIFSIERHGVLIHVCDDDLSIGIGVDRLCHQLVAVHGFDGLLFEVV